MSAVPPKADIAIRYRHVRFVPKADIRWSAKERLFDHPVGGREQRLGYCHAERFGGFKIDGQLVFWSARLLCQG
jgi:hypothetical protein